MYFNLTTGVFFHPNTFSKNNPKKMGIKVKIKELYK